MAAHGFGAVVEILPEESANVSLIQG
jgi:hypothetical protein